MSDEFITFHDSNDLDIINKNLSKIENEARMVYLKNYEPTLDEINSVYDVIKDYIRDNNLIVYGGYAQNALIKKRDSKESLKGGRSGSNRRLPEPQSGALTN